MRFAGRSLVGTIGAGLSLAACLEGESPIVGREPGGSNGGDPGASEGPPKVDAMTSSATYFRSMARPYNQVPFCDEESLPLDASGRATCTGFVAVPPRDGVAEACDCSAFGRLDPDETARATMVDFLRRLGQCDNQSLDACDDYCVCETPQLEDDDWTACQHDSSPATSTPGWCYVAPEQGVGSDAVLEDCTSTRVRFVGDSVPSGAFVLFGCHESVQLSGREVALDAPLGERCLPPREYLASFQNFRVDSVTVVTNTPQCESGLCLVNHFQGRVSCPYGNTHESVIPPDRCYLPASEEEVLVDVAPQLTERTADVAVACSCRCDGPGPGPFCECPEGMQCEPLISPVDLPADASLAGSYCIPNGTAFDFTRPPVSTNDCVSGWSDCGDPRPY
jgi:hypothetical protein